MAIGLNGIKCSNCSKIGFVEEKHIEQEYIGGNKYRIKYYKNYCSSCGFKEKDNRPDKVYYKY